MNRQYLEAGHKIFFDDDTFEIVRTVGAGANCVVYETRRVDNEYTYGYYLKECYPFDASVTRNDDGSLEWIDIAEKERNLKKFKEAYKTLLNIYNDKSFRNSTSIPLEMYETNGTVYFLNDIKTGMTFEEDASENLSDILTTTIVLSRLIEKYHKAGYLHLDIKPENIFLLDETRELVVLFDVDSVVSIDELRNDEVKHISFSENYAAPEQKREKISEINEQTDIYSIGATLFSKIMGRFVTALDRDIFADWDFEGNSVFCGINPSIKNQIKEIFKKTLAVQNKNRYKNTSELIKELEKAKDICECETYLVSDCPSVIKNFVGRTHELNQIKSAFDYGNNIVFLHGFGGIGKSELCKKYACNYRDNYDVILFCDYNESLKNTLNSIPIVNGPKEVSKYNFGDKEKILKTLLNERVLLIIDNFDVDISEDDYLCELAKYKANIIITTRTDFSTCALEGFSQIDISTIDKNTLKELFVTESECGKISSEEEVSIYDILAAYKYHTLFIRPLAYKIKHLGYTIEDLKNEVECELLEDGDLITGVQNNRPYEETLKSLAEKLYKIGQLNNIEQQILSDLYMLGNAKISVANYIDGAYNSSSHKKQIRNNLVALIRKGLVQKDELKESLEIHPIISELINKNINPDISKSREFAAYIQKVAIDVVKDDDAYIYEDENEMSPQNLCGIVSRINIENEENIEYIINLMFDVCKNRKYDWIIHLFGSTIKKISKNDNIKLLYLQFLSMIYTEDFFGKIDGTVAPQEDFEEIVVNYIYDFYKEKNDGSELFSSIFWKMILTFDSLLESFEYWGWNMPLYEKISECISNEEDYGNTLYDYVFYSGDEDSSSSYMTEDGKCIDKGNLIFTPQYMDEIYSSNYRIVNEYNIDTKNKNGFDVYNECVNFAVDKCRKKLDACLEKYKSNSLSDFDIEEIQRIYGDIHLNKLTKHHKDEFVEKYMDIFVLVDAKLKHQTLLNSKDKTVQEIFETILSDTTLDEEQKNRYLNRYMYKIRTSYEDQFSYEAQLEILNCVGQRVEESIFNNIASCNVNPLITKLLFAYLITDYDKFLETINRIISQFIEKISAKPIFWGISFRELVQDARVVKKCNMIYPYISNYVDRIYALSDEATVLNLRYVVNNCASCAEAAYRETGNEEYKREYKRYRQILDDIKKQHTV